MSRLSIETSAGSTHRKELRAACGHRSTTLGRLEWEGGLGRGPGPGKRPQCMKTRYRLQKVVVKKEVYITLATGA